MLRKLIKYDLKWVFKVVGVFYVLSILFSVIGRSLSTIENSTIFSVVAQICIGIAIAMIVNGIINNIIRMWVRFIRNIYKDESYLTHTLPVKKNKIYLAKVLTGIISMFLTVVVTVVCIAICFYTPENLAALNNILEIAAANYETTVISFLLIVFFVLFLEMIFILLAGFLGIIVGHRANHNRMLKSIVYGFLFYLIPQILTLMIVFAIGFYNLDVMNLFTTAGMVSINAVKTIMIAGIGIYIAYDIIYYMLGKKQFEKGVNVE